MANKKFTINSLMESIPEVTKTDIKLEGECFKEVTVSVRHTLPLEDAMNFVKDVFATCVDDEQSEFMPELFDFAVRMYTVMYYANIDLSKDVKKAYRILYDTNLFRQVYSAVDMEQITNLILSAEKRLEHWRNIASSSMAAQVSDLMRKMDDVIAGSEDMMNTINGDDFKTAVSRLADNGVLVPSEAKIVKIENNHTANTVSPDDFAAATELMKGLANKDASVSSGNAVSGKKKKK